MSYGDSRLLSEQPSQSDERLSVPPSPPDPESDVESEVTTPRERTPLPATPHDSSPLTPIEELDRQAATAAILPRPSQTDPEAIFIDTNPFLDTHNHGSIQIGQSGIPNHMVSEPGFDVRGSSPKRKSAAQALPSTPVGRHVPAQSEQVGPLLETPTKMSSDSTDHKNVDALQDALEAELHGTWIFGGKTFLTAFLGSIPDMPPDAAIDKFLQGYDGYHSATRKWKRITVPAKTEGSLYEPFKDHINAILEEFGRDMRCEASATYLTQMAHVLNVYQTGLKTKPDLCIMGIDPVIAREQTFPDPPRYTQCVAPIEIKRQAEVRWEHDVVQLAVYARECFVQQPNRDLVYASLLTEEQMQLHQYDRGGDLHSSFFNIHEDPVTFVKMILALSTEDLKKLGFDTRIYWEGSQRCFRTVSEDSQEVKIYTITEPNHPFRRQAIRGRGTTCWVIEDENGEKFVLKLAWRTFERQPEWHFLEKTCEENKRRAQEEPGRGPVSGVGTILAHWEGQKLSDLRFNIPLKTRDELTVSDRRFYFTIQPYLGPALEKATSSLQSLRALYDIIQGQRELYDLKILHRDISTRNMLCNPDPGAKSGQRAFLIDFDMAKKLDSSS
ncbi:hypothetical protein OE88DRAFT_1664997, partial [Heliocybe sulcata]